MKQRKLRRAISPIIATLLLILIAVAATTMIYSWAIGYAGRLKPRPPAMNERIKIEACIMTVDGDNVVATLYTRNLSPTDANITDAYLLTLSS